MISYGDSMLLREEIADRGGWPTQLTLHELQMIAKRMGDDIDLTATAIVMRPRPQWLLEIAGLNGLREYAKEGPS